MSDSYAAMIDGVVQDIGGEDEVRGRACQSGVPCKVVPIEILEDRDEWATPDYIFNPLNNHFSFDIDVCASEENHKLPHYITEKMDALGGVDWCEHFGVPGLSVAFMNPPYSDVEPFMERAIEQASKRGMTVVVLTNYILDCAYYNELLPHYKEIWLGLNRIEFEPPQNVEPSSNSKPQQLTVITPRSVLCPSQPEIKLWHTGGVA